MKKNKGLGKGLSALLATSVVTKPNEIEEKSATQDTILEIATDKITPSKYQPRKTFNQKDLEELTLSIKHNGLIQPLIVRKNKIGYELVAGERRLRASIMAGLKTVSVIVKKISDEELLVLAIIENIQRKDLTAIEEAESYARLQNEFKLTHEKIAEITGKSRSHITNLLRLLKLDPEIMKYLNSSKISMGHARALLSLPANLQISLANDVIKYELTTAETEKRVGALISGKKLTRTKVESVLPDSILKIQTKLGKKIGFPVKIKTNTNGSGKIMIDYKTEAKLKELVEMLSN